MPGLSVDSVVGEYRIEGYLGAGGMGEVYCALHSRLGRRAAVKILTHASNSNGSLDRFFNEAKIQSSLRHPNVATLYDFTEVGGQPCIIMEYVDGQTLAERIRPSGPLSLSETIQIFCSVVEAIAYVHEHGVVHRDIKSNNIKVNSNGEVKLLDFGIAKSEGSDRLTATGSVIGTLEYISPEQLISGVADARSDIWALGVLLYEMVTGRVPFQALTVGELCKKIERVDYTPAAVLNPEVPRDITAIIGRCLRKNPADRYRSARELLEDVRRLFTLITSDGLILPSGTGRTIRIALANVDRKVFAAIAVGVLMLVVSGGVYVVTRSMPTFGSTASQSNKPTEEERGSPVDEDQSATATQTVTIDVAGGTAKVYRDGNLIGDTPCSIETHIGETVNVKLVRDGFEPLQQSFEVTAQTRTKTFTLTAIEKGEADKLDNP